MKNSNVQKSVGVSESSELDVNFDWTLLVLVVSFIASLTAINTITPKVAQIGPFVLSAGTLLYPLTFLVTDIVNEIWGIKISKKLVVMGIYAQLIMIGVYYFGIFIPEAPWGEMQGPFEMVLGGVPRILIASFTTYLITHAYDVWIYDKLKKAHEGKMLWFRNNVSTVTAQIFDAILFSFLAFAGTMATGELIVMMATTALLKSLVGIADTPLIYLGVRIVKNIKGIN